MNRVLSVALLLLGLSLSSSAQAQDQSAASGGSKPKVTFIELGSDRCIPCRQMKKVMKAVGEKFGDQVKIVFYDVWKDEQKKYADTYKVRLIPTQVFLDDSGKEFHRHEGFYPEKDIAALLKARGIVPRPKSKN
jgi:thioredoxin 1